MNIILATGVFYPEPIAMSQIIKDIAVKLSEMGHKVTVVTSPPCRPCGYVLPDKINESWWNFKRIVLNSYSNPKSEFIGRFRENFSFGKAFLRFLDDNHQNIDVIYANVFPLFCQKMIVKRAKHYGIPVVMHVQDIYPELLYEKIPAGKKVVHNILMPIEKYELQNSAKVIAIAPKLREYLIRSRHLDPAKVEYVYNWQDEKKFINAEKTEKPFHERFTFMYCGSLSSAANLQYILRTFLLFNTGNCRLVFAGSGVLKNELNDIAANNANVEFWEAPSDKIADIQSHADVLVLPLKKGVALSAFPSKFPAYLFSAKPVLAIVEKESDVADSINAAACGWTVEPDDESALIEMFEKLSRTDREVLEKMGQAGYEYSKRQLTTEVNLTKIVDIILSAAEQR